MREEWPDGRPKGWPTAQLRIRGRPFDVYCDDITDVTLDQYGRPMIKGRVASRAELAQGWMKS